MKNLSNLPKGLIPIWMFSPFLNSNRLFPAFCNSKNYGSVGNPSNDDGDEEGQNGVDDGIRGLHPGESPVST